MQEDGIDLHDSTALIPLDLPADEALLALEQEEAHAATQKVGSPSSESEGANSPKKDSQKKRPPALSLSRQSSHQSVMSVTSAACMGHARAISREIQSLEHAVVATEVQLAWQANKPTALQVGGLVSTGRQRAIAAMHEAKQLSQKLLQLEDAAMQCFSGKAELVEEHRVSMTRTHTLYCVTLTHCFLTADFVGSTPRIGRKAPRSHWRGFGGNDNQTHPRPAAQGGERREPQ